jgi:hypothetical protein
LTLSNGQIIWDLSGNAEEWTDGQATGGQPGRSTNEWYFYHAWTAMDVKGSLAVNPFPSGTGIIGAETWGSSMGAGSAYVNSLDKNMTGLTRGGSWIYGSLAGPFSLAAYNPYGSNKYLGFRVAYQ